MNVEPLRAFLLTLPHVAETMQWGDNLVLWVGDKAIGGKMFALLNLELDGKGILSYAAGPERFADLLELEGVSPAPYFARAHWVAVEHWKVFSTEDWKRELTAAHALTLARLAPRTRKLLALPLREQKALIAERRRLQAAIASRNPTP